MDGSYRCKPECRLYGLWYSEEEDLSSGLYHRVVHHTVSVSTAEIVLQNSIPHTVESHFLWCIYQLMIPKFVILKHACFINSQLTVWLNRTDSGPVGFVNTDAVFEHAVCAQTSPEHVMFPKLTEDAPCLPRSSHVIVFCFKPEQKNGSSFQAGAAPAATINQFVFVPMTTHTVFLKQTSTCRWKI